MTRYKYAVLDETNTIVRGTIDASTEAEARELLTSEGQKLIRLSPDIFGEGAFAGIGQKKLTSQEIAVFCRQLCIITRSGISILKGLGMIRSQSESKKIRQLCENIYMHIQKGSSISEGFRDSGYKLPLLLINMIQVGEVSGNLDDIFKKMADYYEKDHRTRKKIISSLTYPFILVFVAIGVITMFTFFILPDLTKIITDSGGKLPWITTAMMDGSKFIVKNYLYIGAAIFAAVITYIKAVPDRIKKNIADTILFKTPVLGGVAKDFVTARFTRTMGILIKTGLSVMAIMDTLEKVVGIESVSKKLADAKERITKGESLTESLENIRFFDPMVINIISIGEETGKLEESMMDLADYYDEKFDSGVTKLISMIEPIFTLGMGVVVGGIVLSAMMPIFNMIGGFSNMGQN